LKDLWPAAAKSSLPMGVIGLNFDLGFIEPESFWPDKLIGLIWARHIVCGADA
jgi:hypothetical protein